jgi:hypothetical protein
VNRRAALLAAVALAPAPSCARSPELDPCANVECSTRGFCLAPEGAAICICMESFHAERLECVPNDPVDPCLGVTCSGHGTCRVVGGEPRCDCEAGWTTPSPSSTACVPGSQDAAAGEDAVARDDAGGQDDGAREDARDPADADSEAPGDAPGSCGNGVVEEMEECDGDPPRACATVCGTEGTMPCVDCAWAECDPPADSCNGADDDCDTTTDEDCAANDECAGATSLGPLGAARTVVGGSTASATNSAGSCAGGNDVWYSFNLGAEEIVYLSTHGSSFDTWLATASTSCGNPAANCVNDGCTAGPSDLVVTLAVGTHYVLVDGTEGAAGAFTLNIEHVPLGADATAHPLPRGASVQRATTTGTGRTAGVCGAVTFGAATPEHLYYWTQCPADPGGTVSANTCNPDLEFRTAVYLRSGISGTDLGCNVSGCPVHPLYGSHLDVLVPSGFGLFGLYVDGVTEWDEHGLYVLSVSRP